MDNVIRIQRRLAENPGVYFQLCFRIVAPLLLLATCCFFFISTDVQPTSDPAKPPETAKFSPVVDEEKPRHVITASGGNCSRAGVHTGMLPRVALLSAPGSGNTWLRWLIERLTGICTGSVYHDRTLKKSGFQCEDKRTGGIVYKTHQLKQFNTTNILLLVRNPFDAILAEFNRQLSRNQTGWADMQAFFAPRFHELVREWMWWWMEATTDTFLTGRHILVVFYENLKSNLSRELRRVAQFLNVQVDDGRIQCVVNNQIGKAKRPGRHIRKEDVFSSTDLRIIESFITTMSIVLKHHGVDNLPEFYMHTR